MPTQRETETNPHSSFCSLHFSQKRKKIEGDSIYIRHSLLMLEVCIPFGGAVLQTLVYVFVLSGTTASVLTPRFRVACCTFNASAQQMTVHSPCVWRRSSDSRRMLLDKSHRPCLNFNQDPLVVSQHQYSPGSACSRSFLTC